jgi:hypothetical protein
LTQQAPRHLIAAHDPVRPLLWPQARASVPERALQLAQP